MRTAFARCSCALVDGQYWCVVTGRRFTDEGGVLFSVQYIAASEAPRLVCTVRDTGVGISEEQMSSIFDAFTQADSSKTRVVGGAGLGLCFCQQVVHLMGGHIKVDSEKGRGSTFHITLPLQVTIDTSDLDASGSQAHPKDGVGPVDKIVRVLVVDDVMLNRRLAVAVLRKNGFAFAEAENGLLAVEAHAAQPFDVILMDLQMPVMDGWEASRKIRELESKHCWPRSRIIALSANSTDASRAEAQAAGIDAFVVKPFKIGVLLANLGHHPMSDCA